VPLLLRITKYNKWINTKPNWLKEGEIPADPISNWQTTENKMSVWVVDNDVGLIEQIVAALAVNRIKVEDFEYVLLDSKIVAETGIKTIQIKGEILDNNLKNLHRDLVEISAQKLLKLTEVIFHAIEQEDTILERVPRKTVARYILDSINKRCIDSTRVKPEIIAKAQELTGYSISWE
jgi:hypothetical protein